MSGCVKHPTLVKMLSVVRGLGVIFAQNLADNLDGFALRERGMGVSVGVCAMLAMVVFVAVGVCVNFMAFVGVAVSVTLVFVGMLAVFVGIAVRMRMLI